MGRRCSCGKPSDGWPDDMCQECWEAYCDKTWWEELRLVQEQETLAVSDDRTSR